MLYFAPINLLSNFVYRHIVLSCGADYVFSELLMVNDLEKAIENDKMKLIDEDIPQTIFQLGVSDEKEVFQGVSFVKEYVESPIEINLNMGCPQSSMQQTKVCGGILYDISLVGRLAHALSSALKGMATIPSIKLRLGLTPEDIQIHEYLQTISNNGIQKVYIHARTFRHGYPTPARYEFFDGLREQYSHMQLIFNGDVDGYESYKKIGGGDVLIARAGLSNPHVFEDIKNKIPYGEGKYAPHVKDPRLIRSDDVRMTSEKITLIRKYLSCAAQHNLRKRLYSANIKWLSRGASNAAIFNKRLMKSEDATHAKKLFEEWLDEQEYL
jgi:tRNA-dihydrouridine synthase B